MVVVGGVGGVLGWNVKREREREMMKRERDDGVKKWEMKSEMKWYEKERK